MSLGESGFFGSMFGSDKYAREKLLADRESIRSYYQNNGYMEFRIESTQVSIAPDKENMFITINTKSITDLLGDQGYAFSKVNPIPEIDHEDSTVSFTIFIDPGKRVYVRRIDFNGNTNTRDEVLRREMRQVEGGWFSTSKLNRSRIRLRRLGFFDEVNIETPQVPNTVDQVDVKINVKERPTGNLLFGVGYSDVDGFLVNGSITESNLFGSGKALSLSFDNSQSTKSVRARYTDPYFTDTGILGGYRLFFTEVDAEQADTAPYVLSTAGAGIFLRLPISEERHIRSGLSYEINTLTVADDGAQVARHFVQQYGRKNGALKVTAGWSQDSLNSAIFPTSGAFERISVEATIPGSDIEYYRTTLSAGIYLPVSKAVTFRTKAGYDVGYGYGDTTTLPFYKNYFAGGSNTVRAYRPRSLGPRDGTTDQPIGGNKRILANMELFFPMPGTDTDNKAMRLSLFVDSGMVYGPGADPDTSLLKYSSGLAFSWFSPIGPLSFSYGFPLNEEEEDKTEKIQFTIGVPFR
jgi:outer membrane protein insertion porin family